MHESIEVHITYRLQFTHTSAIADANSRSVHLRTWISKGYLREATKHIFPSNGAFKWTSDHDDSEAEIKRFSVHPCQRHHVHRHMKLRLSCTIRYWRLHRNLCLGDFHRHPQSQETGSVMKVIGAVASLGGVIQLTVQGVKFVQFLRAFVESCSTEGAAEFIHGLLAYAQLLHDIQAVCNRTQKLRIPSVSQIRIASLRMFLEDCVQDLETWHDIVKRLERTEMRAFRRAGKSAETRSPQKKFQLFLREALGSVTAAKSANVRTAIQARFEKHKTSVGAALSILEA